MVRLSPHLWPGLVRTAAGRGSVGIRRRGPPADLCRPAGCFYHTTPCILSQNPYLGHRQHLAAADFSADLVSPASGLWQRVVPKTN